MVKTLGLNPDNTILGVLQPELADMDIPLTDMLSELNQQSEALYLFRDIVRNNFASMIRGT